MRTTNTDLRAALERIGAHDCYACDAGGFARQVLRERTLETAPLLLSQTERRWLARILEAMIDHRYVQRGKTFALNAARVLKKMETT